MTPITKAAMTFSDLMHSAKTQGASLGKVERQIYITNPKNSLKRFLKKLNVKPAKEYLDEQKTLH